MQLQCSKSRRCQLEAQGFRGPLKADEQSFFPFSAVVSTGYQRFRTRIDDCWMLRDGGRRQAQLPDCWACAAVLPGAHALPALPVALQNWTIVVDWPTEVSGRRVCDARRATAGFPFRLSGGYLTMVECWTGPFNAWRACSSRAPVAARGRALAGL